MSKSLKIEFTCPDCGATIDADVEVCPGCGIEIEWDEGKSTPESDVDEIIEDLIKDPSQEGVEGGPDETELDVSEDVKDSEPKHESDEGPDDPTVEDEPESSGGTREETDKEAEADEVVDEPELSESHDEGESEKQTADDDIEEHPLSQEKRPKLYAKVCSPIGVLFIVLTFLAIMALVLLYQWDIWIRGASESNLGEKQMTAIYVTLLLLFVFLTVSLVDVYRNKRIAAV